MEYENLKLDAMSCEHDPSNTLSSNREQDDFYERWYAKFGKPQTRTMRGDEFMARLKEMIEFE